VSVAGALLEPPAFVASPVAATRCNPRQPVTLLEIHGTVDTTVPAGGKSTGCSPVACAPGVNDYLAPAALINSWWRQLDGCGAPAVSGSAGGDLVSLARCGGGSYVGLALVSGAGHSIPQLQSSFDIRGTLIDLALGKPLASW
jgi:poly(3-hydroxybutyrate) depolymerase